MTSARALFLTTTILLASALSIGAQQPSIPSNTSSTIQKKVKTSQKHVYRPRPVIPPATIVHNPEYLSGEASVTVAANSNPLIRIGMAQNGVTLLEFPAADKFFAVHAGNSDLVTVEKSPSLKRDHHLILRAGSGFLVPSTRSKSSLTVLPATSIITQMDSGMAITLMIYPVPLLKQQAHRLVIRYDRDEVISARRAAGLATNLVGTEVELQSAVTLNSPQPLSVDFSETKAAPTSEKSAESEPPKPDYKEATDAALREVIADSKRFKRWTDARHDLAISTMPVSEINASTRLVAFAVRNAGTETLHIIWGYPDLYVETLNDNRKPVETEAKIDKLYVASNTTDNSIPPGATRYFAIAYEAPILGARQHLKIVVAHMNAADQPATADLTSLSK